MGILFSLRIEALSVVSSACNGTFSLAYARKRGMCGAFFAIIRPKHAKSGAFFAFVGAGSAGDDAFSAKKATSRSA